MRFILILLALALAACHHFPDEPSACELPDGSAFLLTTRDRAGSGWHESFPNPPVDFGCAPPN